MSATDLVQAQLESVLERWKGGDYYEPMPFPPLVVCKPSDSGMPVEQFITLAAWKVGGYAIYRASIELKIEGQADDTQEAYNARRLKDGFSERDWDYQTQDFVPSVATGDAFRRAVTLSTMRPVGRPAQRSTLGCLTFELDEGCLSPKYLFDEANTAPDVSDYEGFLDRNVRSLRVLGPKFPPADGLAVFPTQRGPEKIEKGEVSVLLPLT